VGYVKAVTYDQVGQELPSSVARRRSLDTAFRVYYINEDYALPGTMTEGMIKIVEAQYSKVYKKTTLLRGYKRFWSSQNQPTH